VDVHNLSVAGIHTYFVVVGRSSLLVHNAGACNLVSRIGENPRLVKEAERLAGAGQQASVDALTAQLNAGNLNPGIGTRSLFNGVFEARARDGARVYFRNGPDGVIEVLAKSTKANQQTVINILEKLYG
jgi:putative component of toxin-antitoxin plasmid stabilization module